MATDTRRITHRGHIGGMPVPCIRRRSLTGTETDALKEFLSSQVVAVDQIAGTDECRELIRHLCRVGGSNHLFLRLGIGPDTDMAVRIIVNVALNVRRTSNQIAVSENPGHPLGHVSGVAVPHVSPSEFLRTRERNVFVGFFSEKLITPDFIACTDECRELTARIVEGEDDNLFHRLGLCPASRIADRVTANIAVTLRKLGDIKVAGHAYNGRTVGGEPRPERPSGLLFD